MSIFPATPNTEIFSCRFMNFLAVLRSGFLSTLTYCLRRKFHSGKQACICCRGDTNTQSRQCRLSDLNIQHTKDGSIHTGDSHLRMYRWGTQQPSRIYVAIKTNCLCMPCNGRGHRGHMLCSSIYISHTCPPISHDLNLW